MAATVSAIQLATADPTIERQFDMRVLLSWLESLGRRLCFGRLIECERSHTQERYLLSWMPDCPRVKDATEGDASFTPTL